MNGNRIISLFISETFYFFGKNTFNYFDIYETLCLTMFIQVQSIPEPLLAKGSSTSVGSMEGMFIKHLNLILF